MGTVTLMVRSPGSGRTYPEQRQQDYCVSCAGGTAVSPVIRAIAAGKEDGSGYVDE